ncbi:homeobox-leucine zipper protein hat14 [Phtheirospermum japonicum]|uniref:Homeobox-leucine zipper protein hat14 n=1 Tax=Phtheirospermum japonicum TaxID=374723 RepID=A0A830CNL5_9LAMI|nr:homeobox-leucine zipper protein hat14 [Phtheirospermum japonicum]
MDFSCRKKLRLTRDQTTLLEDSFKQQTTLNTAQKHALAEKLNLKPRQVEVWFQNRRARTKLKQTEVDCEFLKRNCERLSEENWRLKKEVLELRSSMKMEKPPAAAQAQPQFFHHNHAAAAAAAHEKIGKNRGGGEKKAAAMEVVHVSPN